MSRIRSKGTRIERIFADELKRAKIKYRGYFHVVGKPDFVLLSKKIAIFCDGSFWHGYMKMKTERHNFKRRKKFWMQKILNNIERDKKVNRILRKQGWKVIRFWDCRPLSNLEKDNVHYL